MILVFVIEISPKKKGYDKWTIKYQECPCRTPWNWTAVLTSIDNNNKKPILFAKFWLKNLFLIIL